ncbi:hypothetical protein [Providencia stuartii]|uniref:hypothetical protein n=1 Tax=Providencia stuartii TaxID=588 RepID=UPI00146DBD50|nr:hypothetical protein [Providencia stuartii]
MSALFGCIDKALDIDNAIYGHPNKNKFYLTKIAYQEREQELSAFILERFYKFVS